MRRPLSARWRGALAVAAIVAAIIVAPFLIAVMLIGGRETRR